MRNLFLVAQREFSDNVKTKGFWLGLFVVPLIVTVSVGVGKFLEQTKPTRHFVIVDQSGAFGAVVERSLERIHVRDVFRALQNYAQENANLPAGAEMIDLEKIPADFKDMLAKFADTNSDALEQFLASGGLTENLAVLKPFLKPGAPDFEEPKRRFRKVDAPTGVSVTGPLDTVIEELKPYLRGDQSITVDGATDTLFAAILIPANVERAIVRPLEAPALTSEGRRGIQFWCSNLADDELKDEIEQVVREEIQRREFIAKGIQSDDVKAIQRTFLPVTSLNPKKAVGQETVSLADELRQWAPVGFVYFLWLAVFTIAQMLLNNMIEEKSNRLVEVLLSSVTPSELMLGKLLGIAGVGLTVLGSWILYMFLVLQYQSDAEWAMELLRMLKSTGLVPKFAVYFVLGYLLYACLFLTIGSVCNTLKEAQNMMMPLMVIMMVPLITMQFIPREPNGTVARILSWIPIYTPFIMMNRAAADPPLIDEVGTLVLLVATTALMLTLCGRIFRVGVLRTGQPPKLVELFRWVRAKN
ncbi:MAG: ABC transporter permease [Planctomycetota bacterium]